MKKVNYSKEPTVKQMLNMASNLYNKLHHFSNVSINAWDEEMRQRDSYRLYVEDTHSITFNSWKELQDKYFELMES